MKKADESENCLRSNMGEKPMSERIKQEAQNMELNMKDLEKVSGGGNREK